MKRMTCSSMSQTTGLICLMCFVILLAASGCDRNRLPTYDQELDFAIFAAQNGLWNEARFRFENLAKLNPNNVDIHNNLAVSLEALGLFEEAEAEYMRAVSLDPNNDYLKENYKRLKQILKEKAVAH